MSEILNHRLKDPVIVPTDEIIFSIIGEKMELWKAFLNHAYGNYKDVSGDWHYYNDGKQWLFKFIQKKKTLFWASVIDGTFRITFYFGNKAEPEILKSDLNADIIDGFRNAKKYGSIRPVTIVLQEQSDVDSVYQLIRLKSKIK